MTARTPEGILVLGMHRSGTSAVAGLARLLGLATCVSSDLITGMPWNPAGHWESRSLTRLNDRLLAEMGHTWWYPPPSGTRYPVVASRIETAPGIAVRDFDRSHPAAPWVWKDPRTCLTLPFWRQALDRPLAGIVVFRHPIDVATSLRFRNGLPLSFGLALWERYTRLLVEHAGGLPVLVARYDDIVEDPLRWCQAVAGFLADLGIRVRPGAEDDVCRFVDPRQRHSRRGGVRTDTGTAGLKEVFGTLDGMVGAHRSFETPALPVEDPSVATELQSRWPDRPPGWNDPPWAAGAEGVSR